MGLECQLSAVSGQLSAVSYQPEGTSMGLIDRLSEAVANWNFSILGSVYLGPGHILHLPPLQFLAVLAGGFIWVALVGICAWIVFRTRMIKAVKISDHAVVRVLFSAFAFVFLLLGVYTTFSYPPTTDEPHYLAITESLVNGGGVEVSGVYTRKEFMKFYPSEIIDPHTVITKEGKMYSQHTVGLPALIAPGYWLAGRWGTTAIIALLSALLVALLFLLARKAGNGISESCRTAVMAGATAPILFASGTVFTEIPAALLASLSLLRLGGGWVAPVCGVLMPWLHPRYALMAMGLAILDLLSSKFRMKSAGRWLVTIVVSGAGFFAVYHGPALTSILNVLTEQYPAKLEDLTVGNLASVSFANPFVGAAAKIFDRDFGWFPFSLWALALFPGIFVASGKKKFPHRWFLLGAGAYFLLTCLFRNWHGSAFPGRTLIPIIPFIVGYLATGIAWTGRDKVRAKWFGILAGLSILISWILTAVPVLRYGSGRLWLSGKLGPVWMLFPASWFPSFYGQHAFIIWVAQVGMVAWIIWIILKVKKKA